MLGLRGGAKHLEAGDFSELQSGGANSTGGAVDQEALAFAEFGEAVKHLVGGDVVEDEADRFGGIKVSGNEHEMRDGKERVLRIPADHGESGDALAEKELRDSRTEGINVADNVVPRGERKRRGAGVEAVAHEDVGVGDARGKHFDADVTLARRRKVVFDIFQNFRPTLCCDDHARILDR